MASATHIPCLAAASALRSRGTTSSKVEAARCQDGSPKEAFQPWSPAKDSKCAVGIPLLLRDDDGRELSDIKQRSPARRWSVRLHSKSFVRGLLQEAPVRIELTNSRFAVCRLTTW